MRMLIFSLILSSVLAACDNNDNPPPYMEEPIKNDVELSFLGPETEDKIFGYRESLSSVECRYDRANNTLRVVAYKFANDSEEFKVTESLQLTDYAVETNKSSVLKPMEGDIVPSFIFLSDAVDIKYTKNSHCLSYYEFNGDELRGTVSCSALETDQNEKTFVSLEFQCMNQNYLLFEIKQEML